MEQGKPGQDIGLLDFSPARSRKYDSCRCLETWASRFQPVLENNRAFGRVWDAFGDRVPFFYLILGLIYNFKSLKPPCQPPQALKIKSPLMKCLKNHKRVIKTIKMYRKPLTRIHLGFLVARIAARWCASSVSESLTN